MLPPRCQVRCCLRSYLHLISSDLQCIARRLLRGNTRQCGVTVAGAAGQRPVTSLLPFVGDMKCTAQKDHVTTLAHVLSCFRVWHSAVSNLSQKMKYFKSKAIFTYYIILFILSMTNVVKLRQGSGKDGQELVNKRSLMAPNGPWWPKRPFNPCLELTLKLVPIGHLRGTIGYFFL